MATRTAGPSRELGDKLAGRPQPPCGREGGGGRSPCAEEEEQSALHCAGLDAVLQLPAPLPRPIPRKARCAISFRAFSLYTSCTHS